MTADELRAEAARLIAQATQQETQLTEADVKQMYAERRYSDIEQARQQGRLNAMLNNTQED